MIRSWPTFRRWALATAVAALVLLLAGSWYVGGALVEPANRPVGAPPADLPITSTALQSQSGSRLATWHLHRPDSHATLVLLHPIRGNRRSMLDRARLFYNEGYSIVLVDMQAHGESPGEHITIGHLERHDVRAAVTFARETSPQHRVGVVGCSLGGAALLLASPLNVDAAVVEAVYPTITEAVHNRIALRLGPASHLLTPALVWQLRPRLGIVPADLQPIDCIAEVGCPILIAGGSLDRHTTLAETERLYASAAEPKQLVVFDGAAHTDLFAHDGDAYRRAILPFLAAHLRPEPIGVSTEKAHAEMPRAPAVDRRAPRDSAAAGSTAH